MAAVTKGFVAESLGLAARHGACHVITTAVGQPARSSIASAQPRAVAQSLEFDRLRFHDTRHTHATICNWVHPGSRGRHLRNPRPRSPGGRRGPEPSRDGVQASWRHRPPIPQRRPARGQHPRHRNGTWGTRMAHMCLVEGAPTVRRIRVRAGRRPCPGRRTVEDGGAPKGIRIPVAALKGRSPWPLDDGGR